MAKGRMWSSWLKINQKEGGGEGLDAEGTIAETD